MSLNDMQVQVVRYVSECDVEPVLEPCSYAQAIADLREVAAEAPHLLDQFDLTSVDTGRFVSWAL